MQYGKYLSTGERLGSGGNGEVWRCTRDGKDYAIKVLRRLERKRYARFKSEIGVLASLREFEGIVPLLDHALPDRPSRSNPAWYAMPLADPQSAVDKAPFDDVIGAFVYIASRLALLHAQQIYHRDIKLANILRLNSRWCLSDFGLAEWPGAPSLTSLNEAVGPKWTQAPEMRRTAQLANGTPADVYSFAKTLWVALTNQEKGFDGRFEHAIPSQSLKTYHPEQQHLHSLHALLRDCTEHDPSSRPSMQDVHARLKEWADAEFHSTATLEWHHMQSLILPGHVPERMTWYETERIAAILNEAITSNMNHCFFSDGGGMDFERCAAKSHQRVLECDFGRPYVLRPKLLELVLFSKAPSWSYFWLELDELEASGIEDALSADAEFEELARLPDGTLLPLTCLDSDEYICDGEYKPLPKGTRPIVRCLRGAWAIFGKASAYNNDSGTYDGRHGKLGREQFFEYIRAHAVWAAGGAEGIPRVDPDGPLPIGFRLKAPP